MQSKLKVKIFFFSFLFLGGCSLWSDFTAYFNTYYNASKAFELAMIEIKKHPRELFAFKEPGISQLAKRNFEKVIKKCSAILQFHKDSRYFDDALLMLGKAFYYKGQYSKALRKFKELSLDKESSLLLEDKLWMGKTELQLRDFEIGMNLLEETVKQALKEDDEEIASDGLISQIRYLLYSENPDAAIVKIKQLLKISSDDILKAQVVYQLGKIYLKENNLPKAEEAFNNVTKYQPDYKTEFNSLLSLAKIKKQKGESKKALELLDYLLNRNKFKEFLGETENEMADINYKLGKVEEALNYYIDVDSTYGNKEEAGVADFHIAKIYANDYHYFDSAMVYYNKTIRNRNVSSDLKREAMTEYSALKKYSDLRGKLNLQTRRLGYLLEPETFSRDSIIYIEYRRKLDSLRNAGTTRRATVRRSPFGSRNVSTAGKKKFKIKKVTKPIRPKISADSLRSLISETEFELGNLLFGEMNAVDSAYRYYTLSLKHKPNTLNKPKILFAIGNYYLTVGDTARANELFRTVYEKYKYDKIVNEAAKKLNFPLIDFESDPAEKVYIDAENKYLDSNYTPAIKEFLTIPRKFPTSPYAAKAYYTSGFILENYLNLPDSAASLYDSLTSRYRTTEYARAVFPRILFYKRFKKAQRDSIAKSKKQAAKNLQSPDSTVKKKSKKLKEPFPGLKGMNRAVKKDSAGKMPKPAAKNLKGKGKTKEEKIPRAGNKLPVNKNPFKKF